MILQKDSTFTDLKYEADLVVKHIDELVVMAKDKETGYRTIYRREQFEGDNERFEKND